jgi:hypothetical protein
MPSNNGQDVRITLNISGSLHSSTVTGTALTGVSRDRLVQVAKNRNRSSDFFQTFHAAF